MAALGRVLGRQGRVGVRCVSVRRGFRRYEYGLEWHSSIQDLHNTGLVSRDSVPVAVPYEYEMQGRNKPSLCSSDPQGFVTQARKYAVFHSHDELWESIAEYNKHGKLQLFNEVLEEGSPRCLYFDLDGDPMYRVSHHVIVDILRHYVRKFFGGEHLGWNVEAPEPVVLTSSQPSKYSCHVMFPQIQFVDYAHQNRYLPTLLRGIQDFSVEQEGGVQNHLLKSLVDPCPYRKAQLLRGPNACKLKNGQILPETSLQPEEPFAGDELTYFAGYVQPDYALELPSMAQILEWNECLTRIQDTNFRQTDSNLFNPDFTQSPASANLDLAGMRELEKYEVCMQMLHADRACDYWSWFRISGVTASMLNQYAHCEESRERIWSLHCSWSSQYPAFDEYENWHLVMQAQDRKRTPGVKLLVELLKHDNPGLHVRDTLWPFSFARSQFARATA